ncbi:MAG TPA: TonB-dependent receptor [Candidatus Deferrimicrobiaceae bacterium]|nr:TonB-dependent receptor [Candidatus Deferrimicrobiaceae bacterium]
MSAVQPDNAARTPGPRLVTIADCAVLLLLCTATAIAQQESKDLGDVSVQDLEKIQVYSASKHLQDTRDAPSSVTIITSDQIQKYGYRTLADILQSVRGFYVTYDRDYSFVGVRGFGRLGDWNSRVLVLIDGHRTNDNILGQNMIGSEFLVDVDMIERVEIIRGPSSSLYGADAFFAVINVITRKASQLKGTEVSFAPASYGTYEGRASYGGRYKGIDMLLSGTFYNSQGQTLFFPVFDTPATNNGITSNTDYESFQHIVTTVSYRGFTLQGLFSFRDKGVPTGYFGSLFNDSRTKNVDDHQYCDLSYDHSLGESWILTARTSYDQARLQRPVVYPTGLPAEPTEVDTYSFRGNWWDGDIKVSRTLQKHRITLGTEIIDNVRQDQGDYATVPVSFTADPGSSVIWALYGQDEFAIMRKLTLSAGLRHDHYSDFGGTTNPRLGLIYHLFQPTTVKLLYGSAFRAPEPFETTPDFGVFYNDNLQLKPESIHSVEGVVEEALGQHLNLSGSVFQNRIDNLITLENGATFGNSVYQNSGKADAIGVEAELDGRFAGGLQTTASYSYTDAQDAVTHQILTNSPQHLGKLNLAVPMLQRRLSAAVDAQYMSARQTLAGTSVSGFAVFNVTLLGHTLGKHLDLSASVYNILDKKYFDPGRPEDPENVIQQDGRNFRVKLTGRF